MKKILIVNDIAQGGGVEKLMFDLVMFWLSTYHITIATEVKDPNFYSVFPKQVDYMQYSIKKHYRGKKILRKWGSFKRKVILCFFKKKVRYAGFDIVLAMKEGNVTQMVSKLDTPLKIGWVHLDYYNAYWTKIVYKSKQNEVECMKKFNHILCVSEYIKDSIVHVLGDTGNLLTMYNPINVEAIRKSSQELFIEKVKSNDRLLFVTIGRLHFQKGYDFLLQSCKKLEEEQLPYELWIIGEGEEEYKLKKMADELALEHVLFMGPKENPYKYLRLADWFISSSRYEGYSIVSQEAAVLGIPIIATDCSGVRELLGKDGEYGIIMEQGIDSIYLNMKRVINDHSLREYYQKQIVERSKIIGYENRINAISSLFQ